MGFCGVCCGVGGVWLIDRLGLAVLARIVRGIGGALISANSGAVIADVFAPESRGRAYGYNSIGWNLGAILGILPGGFITTYLSWRWIFFINLPIGGVALVLVLYVLREKTRPTRHHLDIPGFVTLGIGLSALLLVMTRLSSAGWSLVDAILSVMGVGSLTLFAWVQTRQKEPFCG